MRQPQPWWNCIRIAPKVVLYGAWTSTEDFCEAQEVEQRLNWQFQIIHGILSENWV